MVRFGLERLNVISAPEYCFFFSLFSFLSFFFFFFLFIGYIYLPRNLYLALELLSGSLILLVAG